uniref:Uncharacterized protein n=1 Tax=Anolis carolinensis TaxID=28377 RepID=A0A803T3J4_ANOCA
NTTHFKRGTGPGRLFHLSTLLFFQSSSNPISLLHILIYEETRGVFLENMILDIVIYMLCSTRKMVTAWTPSRTKEDRTLYGFSS